MLGCELVCVRGGVLVGVLGNANLDPKKQLHP